MEEKIIFSFFCGRTIPKKDILNTVNKFVEHWLPFSIWFCYCFSLSLLIQSFAGNFAEGFRT